MNLENVKAIIRRKPAFFFVVSIVYLLLAGLLKWRLQPAWDLLWYLIGGTIGVYFLDIAEVFFALEPSPFRSILFAGAFVLVSLFIVTSSGSALASGLVLSLYLSLVLWQVGQWRLRGNLDSWYSMIAATVEHRVQWWGLVVFAGLFVLETLLFIR